ncbi:MAG: xanthine phosphoribosyltransferase [Eubacteriales bacterium]|nr:xanthine phosphoribosyltransferase [Eubacteriales bacterium]
MELLKERIRKDGVVKEGNVLKVDSFLNHQMDITLFNEIGKEFKRRFADERIDKILTIEASGIGIAAITAQYFGVPVVFAKKAQSINLDGTILSAPVESFTHKRRYEVIVASRFLQPEEHVLIVDDFLANGCAALGLCQIVEAAHAQVAGIGVVIEKGFQQGGRVLREQGLRVESLAIVDGMDAATQTVQFRD